MSTINRISKHFDDNNDNLTALRLELEEMEGRVQQTIMECFKDAFNSFMDSTENAISKTVHVPDWEDYVKITIEQIPNDCQKIN